MEDTNIQFNWYAINTYNGHEDAVVKNLLQRATSMGEEKKFGRIVVPKVRKFKIKNGKKVEIEEKIYPGYVFVEMVLDDSTRFVVRGTPGVTGFVGSGAHPVPVSPEEVANIMRAIETSRNEKHDAGFEEGDLVLIVDGPFTNSQGKVMGVDKARGRLQVSVSMFGRETPLELDFLQVEKI